MTDDDLFQTISELVMCHSPSGVESEIDAYLTAALKACGVDHWQDAAGNLIAKIAGRGPAMWLRLRRTRKRSERSAPCFSPSDRRWKYAPNPPSIRLLTMRRLC